MPSGDPDLVDQRVEDPPDRIRAGLLHRLGDPRNDLGQLLLAGAGHGQFDHISQFLVALAQLLDPVAVGGVDPDAPLVRLRGQRRRVAAAG